VTVCGDADPVGPNGQLGTDVLDTSGREEGPRGLLQEEVETEGGEPPVGGGGGVGAPASFAQAKVRARADLGKTDCYGMLGFGSAGAAQNWFDNQISFYYASYGQLQVAMGRPTASTPSPASTLGYGQVNINIDYNWDDLSMVTSQGGGTFNYLAFWNRTLSTRGLTVRMNSDQLATLVLIHELGHQASAPRQPSDTEGADEKRRIYKNCIK
jgi:hypothetical protein